MHDGPSVGRTLRIGTRGSPLALWQTRRVAAQIRTAVPDVATEETILNTRGDQDRSVPIAQLGHKGVFTEALESALRERRIDLAVHSLKDLPVEPADGLTIAAVLLREDARDVLVSERAACLSALPAAATIGTSSARRAAQVLAAKRDLVVTPIRGNVETRIRKTLAGEYDAIVVAAAGVHRLGLSIHVAEYLPFDRFLPAPGQGALAVQCRSDDSELIATLSVVDEEHLRAEVTAERTFLECLGGGCATPVGAFAATVDHRTTIHLRGSVTAPDGSAVLNVEGSAPAVRAKDLGARLAQEAVALGAAELLG
jgi:hydroxymethylbilane synthase